MEKLLGLLHEGTIIDLRIVWQLMKRYKFHLVFAFVLFVSLFFYNYYGQPVIYTQSVPVKVVTAHKVSSDMLTLLPAGENLERVTLEELNISVSNVAFLKSLAGGVVKDPNFENLNFGNILSRKPLWGRTVKKICAGESSCMIERLAQSLRGLYYIEQGPTESRFKLVSNAIEKKTADALVGHLVKAIEINRIKILQYSASNEIKNVEELINESRTVLKNMGGYKTLEEQEKLQNDILELKETARLLQHNLSLEIANEVSLQARLLENKKTVGIKEITRENYDALQKVENRLNDIKLNIETLTRTPEETRTASDKLIISQLIKERTELVKVSPRERTLKSMAQDVSFKEKQRESMNNYEFDYLVSKSKIAKLSSDYETVKMELADLVKKKMTNEMKVNGMKTDLDFLKSLEAKQMSLKMLNATMNSDLIFEEINHHVDEFRKNSSDKIFLFCFLFSFFIYVVSIIIRYAIDDKIYGEDEIRVYFKNLDFVGEAPIFD